MFTTVKALPTTKQVELVGRKKFAATALNPNKKIFVVHVAPFSSDPDIYVSCWAQLTLFLTDDTFISIFSKYADFTDGFCLESKAKFPEHIEINNHLINLVDGQ